LSGGPGTLAQPLPSSSKPATANHRYSQKVKDLENKVLLIIVCMYLLCVMLDSLGFHRTTAPTSKTGYHLALFDIKRVSLDDFPFVKSTLAQGFTLVP
jgi:hypothetical protein